MSEYEDVVKAIDRLLKASDDDLAESLKKAGYADTSETVEKINDLEEALGDILTEQVNYFTESFEEDDLEKILEEILPYLISGDISDGKIERIFQKHFEEIMSKLTDSYIKQLDQELSFEVLSDRTVSWIDNWSEQLGKLMKLDSHTEIQNVLDSALENGDSIQTVIEHLRDSYSFSRVRARRTAITEMLTAHSYSAQEAIRQSPVAEKKEWKHTGSHKNSSRPHHQAMDGQIVGKNEKFVIHAPTGSYECNFPRDTSLPASERVNCHCIHRGIVNEDILGLSLEERRRLQRQAIDDDNGAWEKELDAKNKAKAGINEDT